jgi:hypothetical protein
MSNPETVGEKGKGKESAPKRQPSEEVARGVGSLAVKNSTKK